MKRFLIGIVLWVGILFSPPVFSQVHKTSVPDKIDSVSNDLKIAREDTGKVNLLNVDARLLIGKGYYGKADTLARSALELALKLGFKKGQAVAVYNIGFIYYSLGKYANALKNYFDALKIRQDIGDKKGIASSYNNIGNVYSSQSDYPNALKNYMEALKFDEELDDKIAISAVYLNIGAVYEAQGNFPEALKNQLQSLKMAQEIDYRQGIGNAYDNLAAIYLDQGNYQDALKNELQSLKIAEEIGYKLDIGNIYGTIGEIYFKLCNYQEALLNQRKGLKIADEIGNKDGSALIYVNIGATYNKLREYPEVLKCESQGLEIATEIGDKYVEALAYAKIGEFLTQQKKYSESQKDIDSALVLSKSIGNKEVIIESYENRVVLDSAIGNIGSGYNDYKLYINYRDSIRNEEYTRKMVSQQMNFDFDKKMTTEKAEQDRIDIIRTAEGKRKTIITYGAIIILILTIISAGLLLNGQKIKRKKEKAIAELEKKRVEEELVNAKKILGDYTNSMAEKNELLEQFKMDMEKLSKLKSKELEEVRIEQIENLNKATILTEDDWDRFKELFEQVHKGFFTRLKEKMPDLTQAELRLICLTKLKLETKQMAAILGVSFDTIKITRYRLRKKQGLTGEDSVDDIVASI